VCFGSSYAKRRRGPAWSIRGSNRFLLMTLFFRVIRATCSPLFICVSDLAVVELVNTKKVLAGLFLCQWSLFSVCAVSLCPVLCGSDMGCGIFFELRCCQQGVRETRRTTGVPHSCPTKRRFNMVMQCSRRPQRTEVAQFFGAGDSRATLCVNATDRREEYIACCSVRQRYSSTTQKIQSQGS